MFTRLVEFQFRPAQKDKVAAILKDFMPTMKAQGGFMDVLTLTPELEHEKIIALSFWTTKEEALRFHEEVFPKLVDMLSGHLLAEPHVTMYKLETSTLHKNHVKAA